jgi:hypothetical protein
MGMCRGSCQGGGGPTALAKREAREMVSRMEEENVIALASAHGEVEVFARRIALLKGELSEARQARDTAETNSGGLSDVVADVERRQEQSEREC